MSDHEIDFVPADARWTPSPDEAGAMASAVARILGDARDVTWRLDDGVQLRDCGGNFESVSCPSCGQELETLAWQTLMDADFDGEGFRLLEHPLPCCGHVCTLDGLRYSLPQAFSRFVITARNPGRGPLTASEVTAIAQAIGSPVRPIYRRI